MDYDLTSTFELGEITDEELLHLYGLLALVRTQLEHIGLHRLRATRAATE